MNPADLATLTDPNELIAGVPYLLGHHPHESLVLILTDHDDELIVVVRVDLPGETADTTWTRALHSNVANLLDEGVARARLLLYSPHEHMPLLGIAVLTLSTLGITTEDAILVQDTTWARGPWQGNASGTQPIDPAAAEHLARTLGTAPAKTRNAIVDEFATDPERAGVLAPLCDAIPEPSYPSAEDVNTEAGHLRLLLIEPQPPTKADTVRILSALRHTRVRDTLIYDLINSTPDEQGRALANCTLLLRGAPHGFVAPIACLGAALLFVNGDGVRISAALDRALADNPDYSLAQLMHLMLASGRRPSDWTRGVQSLDRSNVLGSNAA